MDRLQKIEPPQKLKEDDEALESLQERLFILQKTAYDQGIANIFLLEGWSSSGRGESLKDLTVRLDPRKFKVYSPFVHQSEDRGYPFLWNFWQYLPRFGEMLFYLNTYYGRLVFLQAMDKIKEDEYQRRLLSIRHTERILTKDKVQFHKFFLHVSAKELDRRTEKAKKEKNAWALNDYDLYQTKKYKKFQKIFNQILSDSESEFAPWTILLADDTYSAKIALIQNIIERLESSLGIDSKQKLELVVKGVDLLP
ncbi:hypothetical protein LPTSP4_08100 [Leptospira ryugenii]|uniref:Polyphosphate kinase-2-related domain-containing protein n=2 Tax=Leptospira ryugenii TaxID=1917863 RepID=A0A2P2DXK0_9LEPT|nr:hypothetical protein LPTSP4_08100 [Leptospira ryugenii]